MPLAEAAARRSAADRMLIVAQDRGGGPWSARELKNALAISQATFERACARLKADGLIEKKEVMTRQGKRAYWTFTSHS